MKVLKKCVAWSWLPFKLQKLGHGLSQDDWIKQIYKIRRITPKGTLEIRFQQNRLKNNYKKETTS